MSISLMAEQERAAVYEGGGGAGGVAYRGDPRLDKVVIIERLIKPELVNQIAAFFPK